MTLELFDVSPYVFVHSFSSNLIRTRLPNLHTNMIRGRGVFKVTIIIVDNGIGAPNSNPRRYCFT